MNVTAFFLKSVWLPLTPRGVAAFASFRLRRLLAVQMVTALLAAAATGWLARTAWTPAIREAIASLPDQSRIAGGVLEWPADSPLTLADGRFLAVVVDLDHKHEKTTAAHVQLELGRRNWEISSWFGALHLPSVIDPSYPQGYVISLNRIELAPWWGAREPFLILLAMVAMVGGLMLCWTLMATVYWVPTWVLALFLNRTLSWSAGWRLAGAALVPAALFLTLIIILYGIGFLDPVQLSFAFAMHLIAGWVYCGISPLFLPRLKDGTPLSRNPFSGSP